MTSLIHQRFSPHVLDRLVDESPALSGQLSDDHRRSLSARFRAVAGVDHRRVDAWMVERGGRPFDAFRWSPATSRRALGNAGLRRIAAHPDLSSLEAIRDEVHDHLARAIDGRARSGSLSWYVAQCPAAVLGLVSAEAANWTTQLVEAAATLRHPWAVASSDAYYDVARARTTLRGRRDLVINQGDQRVVIRVRAGAPGKSAGPGLRCDLTIDAFADAEGQSASRFIGLWPEAGVVLSVDGTMDNLRAGARDLVRSAVALSRGTSLRAA